MSNERQWFRRTVDAFVRLSPTEQMRLRRVVEWGPVGRMRLDDGLIRAGFIEPFPRPHSRSIDLPPEELPSAQVIAADLGLWWERFESTREWNDAVVEAISFRNR